jgi:hypothetical protein
MQNRSADLASAEDVCSSGGRSSMENGSECVLLLETFLSPLAKFFFCWREQRANSVALTAANAFW